MIYRRGSVQRIARGREQSFYADQLVVGLPHVGLVQHQLQAWGASPRVADEDDRLGLALVCLEAPAAVTRLRRQYLSWVNEAVARAEDDGYEACDLDLVLDCLRRVLAGRYAGWLPGLGKNRVLERAPGRPSPSGGPSGRTGTGPGGRALDIGGEVDASAPRPRPQPADGFSALPRGRFPGNGARVGVVDSRLRTHPWLAGGVVAAARDLAPEHGSGHRGDADHATFVTGLVLRQAPGAVVDLRAGLDDDGVTDSWSLAKDVVDLAARGPDVILPGVGCRTDDGRSPFLLREALAAVGPGTVVVAAAGDHGAEGEAPAPVWPAALERVVAVGALDADRPAGFSPASPWVDALAPGVQVVSTCDVDRDGSGGFGRWSGTAFAAAGVTGAIAARVSDGVDGPTAWRDLCETSKRDESGRALIALRRQSGWPEDGDADSR